MLIWRPELLPSDLAWKDGMTDWLPVHQISGVVAATGSVATSVLPSQTVSIGNKKDSQGIAAVVGLLAIGAGIWVFFPRYRRRSSLQTMMKVTFRSQSQLKKQRRKRLIRPHE